MNSGFFKLLLMGLALAFVGNLAAAAEPDQEIQHLLEFVADSGCTFTRNGSAHDSVEAADHLRLKYDRGRRYADSAEHFIERLASKSSWSGKAYTVDCNGHVQDSGDWLHRALDDYRSADRHGSAVSSGLSP